jgi:hypothetical protein
MFGSFECWLVRISAKTVSFDLNNAVILVYLISFDPPNITQSFIEFIALISYIFVEDLSIFFTVLLKDSKHDTNVLFHA